MKRPHRGVQFCWLCSFDLDENPAEGRQWISWAKDYTKNMPKNNHMGAI